jgi:hypothetical protein
MKTLLTIALAVLLAGCNAKTDRNIDERTKYWEKEISAGLKAGAGKSEMESFFLTRGEKLDCYQNYAREDQCDITDNQSKGGFSNKPMKLAVILKIKDGKFVSHSFTTTPANAPN